MLLPAPRGPVSSSIVEAMLRQDPSLLISPTDGPADDPVSGEDLQLALWICYELHYHGFDEQALFVIARGFSGAVLGY